MMRISPMLRAYLSGMLRRLCRVSLLFALVIALFLAAYAGGFNPKPYLRIDASHEILDASGRLIYAFLTPADQWCFPRPLETISPSLIYATLAVEDQRFYLHPGVDPIAITRATWQNLTRSRIISGASTLTMQVAKRNVFQTRSALGKLQQAIDALCLERYVGKRPILEAYLNGAPYGLNLIGCEAAARRYFGKPASELTLAEAALLAAIPKSPTGLMPLTHGDRARARRNFVLERMRAEGYITHADYEAACNEPLSARWHAFPTLAPHLAMQLHNGGQIHAQGRITTTLNATAQETIESTTAAWLKRFNGEITNAAAIAIDVDSGTVLARVGSASFFNTPGGGQVDVCRAPRSPGSALKPFTYAAAIEQQALYPCEMLMDESLDYGLYSPGNFEGGFQGFIPADTALRLSLNVPAVAVLDRVGLSTVYNLLRSAGLTTLNKPPETYGLGLTLGSCDIRLEELAVAYAALANEGEYRPLRITTRQPVAAPTRILSRDTCITLYQMLEQALPDEYDRSLVQERGGNTRTCWKTGTSSNQRDAWAFVFNRQYVVGVWMGNNDGRSSARIVGARAALPLAARIFRGLPPKNSPDWPDTTGVLREIEICALSGLPASSWCPNTKTAIVSRAQYLLRTCDVHYPDPDHPGEIITRLPGTTRGWNLAKIQGPVHVVKKTSDLAATPVEPTASMKSLRILAPADKAEFVITGEPNGDRILLRTSITEETTLYWYLDDAYLGMSTPATPLYLDLAEGSHKLVCLAPNGAIDTVQFEAVPPDNHPAFKNAT